MATQLISPAAPSAPSPLRVPVPDQQVGMMEHLGYLSFCLYLFLLVSRMPEIITLRFGHSFYQIFIASVLCVVFTLAGGGLSRVAGSKLSMLMIGLHIWYLASFPFSYWRSGTLEQLMQIARYLPLAYFTMSLVRTEKQARGAFAVMRLAMLVALVYTMTAKVAVQEPGSGDDRLQLEGGRFANSNEIALFLLIGMPFWFHMAVSQRFPMVLRVLAGLEIALSIFQCLRTGSRGGLITIFLLAVIMLVKSSAINRLKIILLAVAVVAIAVPLLPSAVRGRLLSITGEARDESAHESSESRFNLLMESVTVTARHPIFGVGVGVYSTAAADLSSRAGKRKLWQVSHNAYTQVSAEAGLPALGFFIGTLFVIVRSLWQSKRLTEQFPEMRDLGIMCDCMLLTTLVYIVNGFFANIAQELFYYCVCGIAFSLVWAVQERFDALANNRSQQAPAVAKQQASVLPQKSGFGSTTPAHQPPTGQKRPEPVVGRPRPVSAESLYGDVPWARNPNRRQ